MLLSLYVENIAVIRRLSLELSAGFTAITGETGAGKSVLLDAVKLLLGGRFERELLRNGEESATVSALFGRLAGSAVTALAELGLSPDEEGCIHIQRQLFADGKSRARINGQSVSLSVVRSLAGHLVDLHAQNENLTLMDEKSYASILDGYAEDDAELSEYRAAYAALLEVRRRLAELDQNEAERLRTVEMLRFQIADIDSVAPKPGEDTRLAEKELRVKNSERIVRQSRLVYRALRGAEHGSVCELLQKSDSALSPLVSLVPELSEVIRAISDSRLRLEDAAERLYPLTDDGEGDPTALIDRIEGRLDALTKLKKKYGETLEAVLAFRERASARLAELDASDETVAALRESEAELLKKAEAAAARLSERRRSAASALQMAITEILLYLDMPKVVFRVEVRPLPGRTLSRDGADEIAFVMSANAGEEPRPLSAVASGGELSRTFLALKCVLAERSLTPTMIFDEIDTGVSGKTARKIGKKLKDLGIGTQVLSVTHSAQIASLADAHLLISKGEHDGRTETTLRALDREGRIGELSRILGGIDVTEAQRLAAIELLDDPSN